MTIQSVFLACLSKLPYTEFEPDGFPEKGGRNVSNHIAWSCKQRK